MPAAKELTGLNFGRLTVMYRAGAKNGRVVWACRCTCGKEIEAVSHALTSGHTKSCGCLRDERNKSTPVKHGHSRRGAKLTPTYRTWQAMLNRCTNPKSKDYKNYGARGIKVCNEWQTFEGFLADMGDRPDGLTIERKDPHGDYEPNNCVWATRTEQNRNTRANVKLVYQGRQMTQAEFSQIIGVSQGTVSYRMKAGWTIEQIATAAPHTGNRIASKLGDEVDVPDSLCEN